MRQCDKCRKPKYTRETYWKRNGRPQQGNKNGKFSKNSKSFQAETILGPTFAANGSLSIDGIYLLQRNNLIFCIRSWENQRLLPLPVLVLLHNQVHSVKLLQPLLYRILTPGLLI